LDRYIPGYIYFGDGVKQGYIKDDGSTESPPWSKNGLEITLEEGRGAVETRPF
jgi:D-glycerate 3-kinase